MIAYQPVDPASGLPVTRVPLPDLVGLFLCRRTRPSFSPAALIALIDEFRTVACECGTHFDTSILTAEKITAEVADLVRSGHCPQCGAAHDSHLQFQRNGLILSRESDGCFVWLSPITPNRFGSPIEEHLFWCQMDWSKRNAELAEELNLPDEVIGAWRRKVARLKSPAKRKSQIRRGLRAQTSRPRGSSTNA
jgi:hypothetical protein